MNVSGTFVLGLMVGIALTGNAMTLAGSVTIGSHTMFSTCMLERQPGRIRSSQSGGRERARERGRGDGAAALGRTIGAAF